MIKYHITNIVDFVHVIWNFISTLKNFILALIFKKDQFSPVAQSCLTLCDPMDCSTLGFPIHHHLPELAQTRDHSRWCHPTILSSVIPFSYLQSFPASGSFQMSQFFPSGGQSIGSFSFNISPSNEHSGLISCRMDWLDLLAVQGTLKSLKSISSLVFSFLYGPTLTSIHDYWKNHSFD